jgi:hypothetical protein
LFSSFSFANIQGNDVLKVPAKSFIRRKKAPLNILDENIAEE